MLDHIFLAHPKVEAVSPVETGANLWCDSMALPMVNPALLFSI